jgi:hypothetical protein
MTASDLVTAMPKRPLTSTELQAHLSEQIGFLEASAAAFDLGFDGEAKRLALTLRVLLHDTAQSHSLLGQLDLKNREFIDTALKLDPANRLSHGGLVFAAIGAPRTRYVAMLDAVPTTRLLPFFDWWNAPVFVDQARNVLTREKLVLTAANQDGGGHVDPALDETYYKLSRENALGFVAVENGVARPMEGPEKAAIRQIAHEVLKTIRPKYSKTPSHPAGVFAGGMSMSVVEGDKPVIPMPPMAAPKRKIGRNEPCFCGSGKKYKRCHGRPV